MKIHRYKKFKATYYRLGAVARKPFVLKTGSLALVLLVASLVVWHPGGASAAGAPNAVADSSVMYQDSGPITINWSANDDLSGNATLNAFDNPSSQGGTVSDNGNGTFSYNPANGYTGGDTFTYTICNNATPTPDCSTAAVSITVVPTSKCLSGFYQVLSGQINVLDTSTNPANYVKASAKDTNKLNATGYNPNDGLIYGYEANTNEIVSFNPKTSVFKNVYKDTGPGGYFAGDFDSNNNLYYNSGSQNTIQVYNTESGAHSSVSLSADLGVADISYVPSEGKFYGLDSSANLVIFDPTAPTSSNVTTQTLTGDISSQSGSFGATWVTDGQNLYAFNNGSGNIYSINLSTDATTLKTTSTPNGTNDGMSCANAPSPFDASSTLDYGDAPDSYGTTSANNGASAVVNTSYRLGNYIDVDSDGQPNSNANGDDTNGTYGNDEDGAFIGTKSLQGQTIYQGIDNHITASVPLNNGYVSMWIDNNHDGVFQASEEVATDVSPSSGVADLSAVLPDTVTSPTTTFVRVRLAARTGGGPTGLYSFGEVEDYKVTINPQPPTITNDSLAYVTPSNVSSYTLTGTCAYHTTGNTVTVKFSDGSTTVTPASTACSSGGTFSVTANLSSLNDGIITATSTINDNVNGMVSDSDTTTKDLVAPTITNNKLGNVTAANESNYPVSGVCTANGDNVVVTISDGTNPDVTSSSVACASGTFSTNLDVSSLNDGSLTVDSVIADEVGNTAHDSDTVTKDSTAPTITNDSLAAITKANIQNYPVSGVCTKNGDSVSVSITDGTHTVSSSGTACLSGTFSTTADISTLDPGTLTLASTIDDGVNSPVHDSDTVTMPTFNDGDDASPAVEKAGPHGGDGNNDGVSDYLQPNVTTKVNPIIGSYMTLQVSGGCNQVSSFTFDQESALAKQDASKYDYKLGLNGFVLHCTNPGQTANVKIIYNKKYDTSSWNYRKYMLSTQRYIDFNSQVTYGTETIAGVAKTTVSFVLTDGGPYDSDGLANGTITDPAGPAIVASASTTASKTTKTSANTPDTGYGTPNHSNPLALAIGSLALVSVASGLALLYKQRCSKHVSSSK